MDKNLELKLKKDFPDFFIDLYGDPKVTCMAFGIQCGDGWYDLIRNCCLELKLNKANIRFAQIKEKWGTLTIYVDVARDLDYDIIDKYYHASRQVCEECGKIARLKHRYGWFKVICDECDPTGEYKNATKDK